MTTNSETKNKPSRIIKSNSKRFADMERPYRHCTPLQIRFSDIDIFGHVNNSVYSSMVDIGKVNYFNAVMGKIDYSDLCVVVAAIHFDFVEPTHLTDRIEVWTMATAVSTHSFRLEQRIIDADTGHTKCAASSVMCAISRDGVSAPLPLKWVESLEAYEESTLTEK